MRTLQTTELKLVAGGIIPPSMLDPVNNGVTNSMYWSNYFGTQIGVALPSSSGPAGGGGGTLTPAERAGLTDVEAAQLVGWIEVLGAVTDPATALESDDGIVGISAVDLDKETTAMKMYCTDHEEGWAPGPDGSPGVRKQ